MKKISLVELSKMENKPKEVSFGGNIFYYENNNYWLNNSTTCDMQHIKYSDLNKPLIEYEEEILTEKERKFLISYINMVGRKTITKIEKYREDVLLIYTGQSKGKLIEIDNFGGLKLNKEYTLEDLGL